MEKQFTTLLFLLFPLLGIGQTNVTTTPANYDYSRFASNCKSFITMKSIYNRLLLNIL